MSAQASVQALFHYPVKGLSAQPLDSVTLTPGMGFPLDRAFGFARPGSGFDPDNPKPLPKTKFVMLARDAALAGLETRFDEDSGILRIDAAGQRHSFNIQQAKEAEAAAAFIAQTVDGSTEAMPTLYSAHPHRFTDVSVRSEQMMNAVSLINLDSVAQFGRDIGQTVDPARFRANILFSGLPTFAELEMVGETLRIGAATLRVILRTKRCPATQVNPQTCARDIDVPRLLRDHYGHPDMGVYAEVLEGGLVKPGDAVAV